MTLQQIKTLVDEATACECGCKYHEPKLCQAIELLLADRAQLIEAFVKITDHTELFNFAKDENRVYEINTLARKTLDESKKKGLVRDE